MTRTLAALLLAMLVIAAPAAAQTFPKLTGRVVDGAGLLRPEQVADLTSKAEALEAASGRQFVVATVRSLEGRTIEDYGYRLGREWGIGAEDKDDGVILLVAPNEKKVRIETGYGARVFLTDAVSSVIIRNSILPKFKAGDMAGGIMAGADAILTTMALPPEEAARRAREVGAAEEVRQDAGGFNPMPIFVVLAMVAFVILSIRRRAGGRRFHRRRGRSDGDGIDPMVILWGIEVLSHLADGDGDGGGWGGGGGGGGGGFGGFSGGGGSFGGGGASGGW